MNQAQAIMSKSAETVCNIFVSWDNLDWWRKTIKTDKKLYHQPGNLFCTHGFISYIIVKIG